MLHVCFAAGLRVSELTGLLLTAVTLQPTPTLRVVGKGRKERSLPLWKQTAADLRAWLAVRGDPPAPELFLNASGRPMTRVGFTYILRKHVSSAAKTCPSLREKRAMRLTVLQQQTKALQEERPETGAEVSKRLESLKLLLWHGNTEEALERLGDLLMELS